MDYPTEEQLEIIKNWKADDLDGMMTYIKPLWKYSDCGYWQETYRKYFKIATAGWSGNEEIIGAMMENVVWWTMFWCQSRRGGSYVFAKTLKDWLGLND